MLVVAGLAAPMIHAQPMPFGSADDPWEQIQQVWWQRENTMDVRGGLALIGPQWYAGGAVGTNLALRSVTARLEASMYGNVRLYDAAFDEWYDALRTISFARYNPPPAMPIYVRVGPIERMRLGTAGHLVNFFNSHVAWDERTIGTEFYVETPYGTFSAFTDNVLFDGAIGGHYAVQPLRGSESPLLSSATLGLSYVTDIRTWQHEHRTLTGFALEAHFDLVDAGAVNLSPFVSIARYVHHGLGTAIGADLHSRNFIDLARFRLRLALYYNGNEFTSGYLGPFYTINHAGVRILDGSSNFTAGEANYAGVPLNESAGGPDLVTEIRILFFENFEFWYYFRRHYGHQRQSTVHLRLFARSAGGFRFQVGQDRGGLEGFGSLFSPLNDLTSLVFRADYPVDERLWLFIRSRYTYEQIGTSIGGVEQFLVERRFEPSAGLRFVY